jgi:drug/metabolite transporter (DMT)-like permease
MTTAAMKLRATLLMLFVVAIWGTTFVLVKNALADATPLAFNVARMVLAFAVLAVAYRSHWREVSRGQLAAGALVGFFLAIGYQFQTAGLARTTPSKSAFITGLVVVLVPLFSVIPQLRPPGARAPRWNAFLGALLAFIGILLLTIPGSAAGFLPDLSSINLGDILSFACAIGFAFHCIALGHASPRIRFQPLALLQIGFCALFMAISMPVSNAFIEHPHLHLTLRLGVALAVSAVLSTAVAFSVQSWAQSVLPSTHIALLTALEPAFAWITSFLVIGERLGLRPASGAILIMAGIAMTELMPQPHIPTAHEA